MEKEIKFQEKKKEKSLPEVVWEQIKKNKKILLAISLVAFLIMAVHLPQTTARLNQSGGLPSMAMMKMGAKMQGAPGAAAAPEAPPAGGDGGKAAPAGKKGFSMGAMGSPLTSGVNVMWWILKSILLFYCFLLFITVVPSLPIILYITVFYFIIKSLIGKIQTV